MNFYKNKSCNNFILCAIFIYCYSCECNAIISPQSMDQNLLAHDKDSRVIRATNSTRNSYRNKILIITSILSEPYLMEKSWAPGGIPTGNDRYEGYCKDLTDRLADLLGFQYELRLVNDSKYGQMDKYGVWDGMIGELVRREVDIAIAPLTITLRRKGAADFGHPFMSVGISILMKKPALISRPGIFSFMYPLSRETWVYILLSYIGVWVTLALVSRLSRIRHRKRDTNCEQYHNNCDSSMSSSIVWTVCGFFTPTLIPINSVDALSKQTDVEYGLLSGSSTQAFFQGSSIPTYKKMWEYMRTNPQVFVNDYREGIRRVRESNGKYAFLMGWKSTSLDYINHRLPCDTMKVGPNLDEKGYGIATPKGSPYGAILEDAIIKLQEDGVLAHLRHKWWSDRSECGLKMIMLCRLERVSQQLMDCVGSALQRRNALTIGSIDPNIVCKDYKHSLINGVITQSDTNCESIVKRCLNIESLYLNECLHDCNGLQTIVTNCPKLKCLTIADTNPIALYTREEWLQMAQQLATIGLTHLTIGNLEHRSAKNTSANDPANWGELQSDGYGICTNG
ncbi:unnamed protein product [Oppiella nova]|uniref:Ionotropic glutamate receptor n=1 Tax=Oppiella nova TaxID=334625 RepID=A0A7R9LCY7_9ACAR|nr:unnamed protein product [Oppiella nova]CAG2162366.1 unnamed protein product [Oppiella nova]